MRQPVTTTSVFWFRPHATSSGPKNRPRLDSNQHTRRRGAASQISQSPRGGASCGGGGSPTSHGLVQAAVTPAKALYSGRVGPSTSSLGFRRASDHYLIFLASSSPGASGPQPSVPSYDYSSPIVGSDHFSFGISSLAISSPSRGLSLPHSHSSKTASRQLLFTTRSLLETTKKRAPDCSLAVRQLHSLALDPATKTAPTTENRPKLPRDMRTEIYCTGTLLAAVQNSRLFADCKHFVDMALKHDPEIVLKNWEDLVSTTNGEFTTETLANFVNENFDEPGCELEEYKPEDFDAELDRFSSILDLNYRQWAKDLHLKWPTLCRRVAKKVLDEPERFSLLAVPNPFVIPGGRFREIYYWDSFFIVKGLLASGMHTTARGMIENMGHLITHYGFIPNGNRVYYLNRSQPPLLTWALHAYYQATNDLEFVKQALVWLEKEMNFFTANKTVQRPEWKAPLFRYHVIAAGPRPESYREDLETAEHIPDLLEKCRLWGDIAAAAESGRDFSSRWFNMEGPLAGKLGSTRTSQLLPVELNAIICGNYRLFAELYDAVGQTEEATRAREMFTAMCDTIHEVLWDEEDGCWFDYDLLHDGRVKTYVDTNFYPLYTGCTHDGFDAKRISDYLNRSGAMEFPGGIPNSLVTTGEQWDFPNGWAPNMWVTILGLRAYGQEETAKAIADKWVRKNYFMWLNTGKMFEKYNISTECCKANAGGGEYELQEGFGWTNGVILDLLMTYKDELAWTPDDFHVDCMCCHLPAGPQTSIVQEILEPVIEEIRQRKMSMSIQEPSPALAQATSAEAC